MRFSPTRASARTTTRLQREWLLVLEGAVLVRTPTGEQKLTAGEIACFAPGHRRPQGLQSQQQAAKIVMFSSAREPAVAVYPDSDKIGVTAGQRRGSRDVRREDGQARVLRGRALSSI